MLQLARVDGLLPIGIKLELNCLVLKYAVIPKSIWTVFGHLRHF